MRYALIRDGLVANVILATADAAAFLTGWDAVVPAEGAGPGWLYDAQTGALTPPSEPEQPAEARIVSLLAFRRRFTFAEDVTIRTAATTDMEVAVLLDRQGLAAYIDLDDAEIGVGLAILAGKGLITAERAAAIQSAAVQAQERPEWRP